MFDLGTFMGALACFVVELIVFGGIVTLFVMGHFRRAWTGSAVSNTSKRNANQLMS